MSHPAFFYTRRPAISDFEFDLPEQGCLYAGMSTGVLYVLATPIGNLEDFSPRGIRVLGEVDLIACEDTRHSQKLLTHFNIHTPLSSFHGHNENEKTESLVRFLQSGKSIALISDAGTPGISDPGYPLLTSCHEHQIPVLTVPGPCAAIAALSISGLPMERFLFVGFLPHKPGKKKKILDELVNEKATLIFYESPFRVEKTMRLFLEMFGERMAFVAHELTKYHEECHRGLLSELVTQSFSTRGEWVLIVEGKRREKRTGEIVHDTDLS